MSERAGPPHDEERQLEALIAVMTAHPLRNRILAVVAERVEGMSIREIGARIGEPERRVRHHLEALHASGLVGVARQEERRGALVRYWRAERTPLIWSRESNLTTEQLEQLGTEILRLVIEDAAEALKGGTLAAGDSQVFGRIRRSLDREGCVELKRIYERALREAAEVARASAERAAAAGDGGTEVSMALLMFEVPGRPGATASQRRRTEVDLGDAP